VKSSILDVGSMVGYKSLFGEMENQSHSFLISSNSRNKPSNDSVINFSTPLPHLSKSGGKSLADQVRMHMVEVKANIAEEVKELPDEEESKQEHEYRDGESKELLGGHRDFSFKPRPRPIDK
jgi:hypothetical protein